MREVLEIRKVKTSSMTINGRVSKVHVSGEPLGNITMRSGVPQVDVKGPNMFLLFDSDLPDAVQARTLLFGGDVKLVTRLSSKNRLQRSLISAWNWSEKWGLLIHPAKCNYLTIGQGNPLSFSFFSEGSGTRIPVSKLAKDLDLQMDNAFSPSA